MDDKCRIAWELWQAAWQASAALPAFLRFQCPGCGLEGRIATRDIPAETVASDEYKSAAQPVVDEERRIKELADFLFDQYGQGHYTMDYAKDNAKAIWETVKGYLRQPAPVDDGLIRELEALKIGDVKLPKGYNITHPNDAHDEAIDKAIALIRAHQPGKVSP